MKEPTRVGPGETNPERPVSAELYSTDYFLSECEGFVEFRSTSGANLSPRLAVCLDYAQLRSGATVLDLGTGRGEMLRHCAARGAMVVGLDYSTAALGLAQESLEQMPSDVVTRVGLVQSDVKTLPFVDGAFDLVMMLDIVEHLHPWELEQTLIEVRRVLKTDGRLLIHTMPNVWYYRFGYPLYRAVARCVGTRLPVDPRDRWAYVGHVHVNEQSMRSLGRMLRRCGFAGRVWLHHVDSPNKLDSPIVRVLRAVLGRVFPLNLVFCNDIFALAHAATDRG